MAEQEVWTVGAAPDCDILVDHPTVSGRHCRLTRNGAGFLLEDLDSTNGTFVNGARVTAPVSVTSTDDVRLGPETPVPWDKIDPRLTDQKVIRIGRSADNDVVLDYPNISGNHARIVIVDGQATIEDLGSTNGVAIGKPDNLAMTAPLRESDTVFFGSMAVPAADLLHPGRPPSVVQSTPTAPTGSLITPWTIALGAAALAVVAVVAGVVWRLSAVDEPVAVQLPTDQPPLKVVVTTDDKTVDVQTVATRIAEKPADAVYAVLVQNKGTSQLMQIGTAWGVGKQQLVTSGVVARYLEKYRGDLTAIQVSCTSLEKVFVVTGVDVHPEFKKAELAAKQPDEVARKKRQQFEEIQTAKEPPSKDEVTKLVEELIDAEEEVFLAGERMVFHDIGLLRVEETLPFALPLKQAGRKPAIQAKTTLSGTPYDPETMASAAQYATETLPGSVRQVVSPSDDKTSQLRRLQISSPAGHHSQKQWRGSPVLNDAGAVIGVYARPTPPVDPTKPMTGKTFDAVLIDQLSGLPVVPLTLPKK